jgi:hypothetical protein
MSYSEMCRASSYQLLKARNSNLRATVTSTVSWMGRQSVPRKFLAELLDSDAKEDVTQKPI